MHEVEPLEEGSKVPLTWHRGSCLPTKLVRWYAIAIPCKYGQGVEAVAISAYIKGEASKLGGGGVYFGTMH